MRRTILAIGAFGLAVGLTHSLFGAIIAGVVTFALTTRTAPTKIVMIHDFKTGETKAQPMDIQTQRYLDSREKNGN